MMWHPVAYFYTVLPAVLCLLWCCARAYVHCATLVDITDMPSTRFGEGSFSPFNQTSDVPHIVVGRHTSLEFV